MRVLDCTGQLEILLLFFPVHNTTKIGLIIFVLFGLEYIGAEGAVYWCGLTAGIIGMICVCVAIVHKVLILRKNQDQDEPQHQGHENAIEILQKTEQ